MGHADHHATKSHAKPTATSVAARMSLRVCFMLAPCKCQSLSQGLTNDALNKVHLYGRYILYCLNAHAKLNQPHHIKLSHF